MRNQFWPEKLEPQVSADQIEAREARPSGAIRVAADVDAAGPDEPTLRFTLAMTRRNAPVPRLPSVLVDAYYLQTVSSVMERMRARRRRLSLAAVAAFACGALTWSVTAKLMHNEPAPIAATNVVRSHVGSSVRAPQMPLAAAPRPEAAPRARMEVREAAKQVRSAQELLKLGRAREARVVLSSVLADRPGYPAGLTAMAELELSRGQATAAVRWARLAVRALPRSAESWKLLGHACAAAGLTTESTMARARAAELSAQQ